MFMSSASNLVVKTTFYGREQVLVYVFYTVAKKFFYTMVQVILCISEHVIDGCFRINVCKNGHSKLCVAGSFFEFGYHLDSKLTTSILCDPKCCLFPVFFFFNFAVWCPPPRT